MNDNRITYDRIAEAIAYLTAHFRQQPTLADVAGAVHFSEYHFQRLFTAWAGVSPKQFLKFISLEHAKSVLRLGDATLQDAADAIGLSGTGRLHDLFVTIEAMTPGEFANGGVALNICYQDYETPFGHVLVANTGRGICHISFYDQYSDAVSQLAHRYPAASLEQRSSDLQQQAVARISSSAPSDTALPLHISGTPFQLKVWEALLTIPQGRLVAYSTLADRIGQPSASRAVGTAIGRNPIAYLIPCHRVIQATGAIGGYMWGPQRKAAIIGWEMAMQEAQTAS